jgi:hypothetical protein
MKKRSEMHKLIEYTMLESIRLASTHFDDPEERGHYEDQLDQTIECISQDMTKKDVNLANQLNFLFKKLGFTHESKILENGIAHANKEINNPLDNVNAAFDYKEKEEKNHIGNLFLAKKITDATLENIAIEKQPNTVKVKKPSNK